MPSLRSSVRLALPIAVLMLFLLPGCYSDQIARHPRTTEQLLAARRAGDARLVELEESITDQLLVRIKAKHDAFAAGRVLSPPVVDFLIISGGGDWGAFAAGVLKGWEKVPDGPMAKPREFDAVTGVSTGALIAPFAFLGDPESTDAVVQTYRNPKKDWVKPRRLLSLLAGGSAYADIPGLERELKASLDMSRLQRIADAGTTGRMLCVNLTNIDNQEMCIFDIVEESRRAVEAGKSNRVIDVLLGSAALPGIFPPREIDGVLYVDGSVTANIFFGGPRPRADEDTFVARWLEHYPGASIPRLRYWIIFNNEVRWPPEVVPAKWSSVLGRSVSASMRAATLNSIRLLKLQGDVTRLRHKAEVEVRLLAVPDGWVPPEPGTFKKKTMNALADLGEKMGADPSSWRTSIPQTDSSAESE